MFELIDFTMAKLLLIFFFCFITGIVLKAQDLNVDQTLAYINKQLNEKDNKSMHTSFELITVYNYSVTDIWDEDYFYNVKIDHGYLVATKSFSSGYVYHPDYSTYQNRKYSPVMEEFSVPITEIDNEYDYSTPYQNFLCNTQSEYHPSTFIIHTKDETNRFVTKIVKEFNTNGDEKSKKTEKVSSLSIEFSNKNLVCDKLRNAFVHLLNLISKDTTYSTIDITVEKDPFESPSKKDTLNSNGISITNSNSVPMTKNGGVYEIPVIINGALKLNFVFDAGASDVSISPDVALTLIRTGTVNEDDFLGTETYKFADGSIAKSKVFILKEIQLGNKKVYNVRASISNSIKAPLLLGQSVLNKFGKVTIDYNKGVIIFQN